MPPRRRTRAGRGPSAVEEHDDLGPHDQSPAEKPAVTRRMGPLPTKYSTAYGSASVNFPSGRHDGKLGAEIGDNVDDLFGGALGERTDEQEERAQRVKAAAAAAAKKNEDDRRKRLASEERARKAREEGEEEEAAGVRRREEEAAARHAEDEAIRKRAEEARQRAADARRRIAEVQLRGASMGRQAAEASRPSTAGTDVDPVDLLQPDRARASVETSPKPDQQDGGSRNTGFRGPFTGRSGMFNSPAGIYPRG